MLPRPLPKAHCGQRCIVVNASQVPQALCMEGEVPKARRPQRGASGD